jgi:hypothetical protein
MNYQELAINLAIVGHYRRQQDKAPAGWQKSIATDGQAHSAVQLFTSLRLLNPEFTENEAMRRAVQFETEAFITSQTKDHYMERLKTQLSQMQDLRQSQLPDTSPRDKSNATARNPFKRRSEEGIDMKFSPSDWDAKFEGKPDYFAPTMPKGTSGTHNTLASSMDLVKINHMANMGQQSNPQQQFAQTVLSPTPFDPQLAPRLVREAQQRVAATQQQRFFAAEHSQQQMLKVSDQQFQGMLANFIRPQGEQRLHNLLALLQQSPGIITATDDKLFPPNVLNAQIEQSLRTDIKTWAQVKHWAGQNPALIPNIDGNKFVLLQVLHFQDQLIKQKASFRYGSTPQRHKL